MNASGKCAPAERIWKGRRSGSRHSLIKGGTNFGRTRRAIGVCIQKPFLAYFPPSRRKARHDLHPQVIHVRFSPLKRTCTIGRECGTSRFLRSRMARSHLKPQRHLPQWRELCNILPCRDTLFAAAFASHVCKGNVNPSKRNQ